jgi:hypothetical protein
VVAADLKAAKATKAATEDRAIQAGIEAHQSIQRVRDARMNVEFEKARATMTDLLDIPASEIPDYARHCKGVTRLQHVEYLVWVCNNRDNSLDNLRKLRRVYEALQAA